MDLPRQIKFLLQDRFSPLTKWIEIVGGNHAQFGWYGPQPGDNPADISREEQQRQVVEYTVGLLKELAMPDS
jgi:hypothetical protein